jgi:hypothetical protein
MTGTHRQVEEGLQHHGAGRLLEAEALYREALADDPQNIDALRPCAGRLAHIASAFAQPRQSSGL